MKIDNVPHPATPQRVDPGQGKAKVANIQARTGEASRAPTRPGHVAGNTSHDIDHVRVAELRQALADGSLTMDTDRVADRLIDSVRDLLGGMQ